MLTKTKNLSRSVANVVFGPTLLAYGWTFLGYPVAGLILYLVFTALAYKMELFEHLRNWPCVSQAALFSGPLLLVVGLYFSAQPTGYSMLLPGGIYMVLSIVGGLALIGKFNA